MLFSPNNTVTLLHAHVCELKMLHFILPAPPDAKIS